MKSIEVSAAIIFDSTPSPRVLATKRGYGDLIGKWEFPGGKLEPGETGEEAIVREIKEELSVNIIVKDYLTTIEYDYPSFHLIMHCYICTMSGTIKLKEHQAMKWCPLSELQTLDWCPADRLVITALNTYKYLPEPHPAA